MAQFPLGMGKGGDRRGAANTLALTLDSEGKVRYDAIVKYGHDKDKVTFNSALKYFLKNLFFFILGCLF